MSERGWSERGTKKRTYLSAAGELGGARDVVKELASRHDLGVSSLPGKPTHLWNPYALCFALPEGYSSLIRFERVCLRGPGSNSLASEVDRPFYGPTLFARCARVQRLGK